MIHKPASLKKFEDDFHRSEKRSFDQSLKIFTALWNEAVLLGVLPPKDPLEGIDVDIRLAKVLHSCSKKSFPG
jgi:hypothetical protein